MARVDDACDEHARSLLLRRIDGALPLSPALEQRARQMAGVAGRFVGSWTTLDEYSAWCTRSDRRSNELDTQITRGLSKRDRMKLYALLDMTSLFADSEAYHLLVLPQPDGTGSLRRWPRAHHDVFMDRLYASGGYGSAARGLGHHGVPSASRRHRAARVFTRRVRTSVRVSGSWLSSHGQSLASSQQPELQSRNTPEDLRDFGILTVCAQNHARASLRASLPRSHCMERAARRRALANSADVAVVSVSPVRSRGSWRRPPPRYASARRPTFDRHHRTCLAGTGCEPCRASSQAAGRPRRS